MKNKILTVISCSAMAASALGDDILAKTKFVPEKSAPFTLRASAESFSSEEIPLQKIANLLWAANGINRGNAKRTAPSAFNRQEIEIFVCSKNGVFSSEIGENSVALKKISGTDIRAKILGPQSEKFDGAPVILLLVADLKKFLDFGLEAESSKISCSIDCGAVMQNILLFCAENGLDSRPRMTMEKDAISKELAFPSTKLLLINIPLGVKK